jgi:hypothetical protein
MVNEVLRPIVERDLSANSILIYLLETPPKQRPFGQEFRVLSIKSIVRVLALGMAAFSFTAAAAEDDSRPAKQATWHVSRTSGDVWLIASGVQQASLSQEAALNPGDTIRTGANGRVLLTRGAESMTIAPNSVIGLPAEAKDGMSTTIVQQAGSVLLDVEKRNVQHFAVETPYLAAVVKGTQFRVTVTASGANVAVSRGQVEVADFKSGQIAQVLPGQMAKVFASGQSLSLSGSGTFLPIERGQPRAPSVDKVMVPRGGFIAPRAADGLQVRNLNEHGSGHNAQTLANHDGARGMGGGAIHVSTALGDVKLNFSKVTHGMARGVGPAAVATRDHGNKDTVWNSDAAIANPGGSSSNSSALTAVTTVTSAPPAATVASSTSGSTNAFNQTSANQGNGNGNGNAGNGNNGNGNAGNGNNGNGIGNQANNGNGNGIGNGNGNGRGRK